jgi:hypothetical protein
MSDSKIIARFDAFKPLAVEAVELTNSSGGLKGDAAIRAHRAELQTIANCIRQEYAVLSELNGNAARFKNVLKDIQQLISTLDDGIRECDAMLGDAA